MHSPETLGRQITFFFTDCHYLLGQRGASPHTVHSYRDTFRLLLGFAARRAGKKVADLAVVDLGAPAVLAFLEHLESGECSIATRNVRLAAIRTFFRIIAANVPTAFEQCQRVIVIPRATSPTPSPLCSGIRRSRRPSVSTATSTSRRSARRSRPIRRRSNDLLRGGDDLRS